MTSIRERHDLDTNGICEPVTQAPEPALTAAWFPTEAALVGPIVRCQGRLHAAARGADLVTVWS